MLDSKFLRPKNLSHPFQVNCEDPMAQVMKWIEEEEVKWSNVAYIGKIHTIERGSYDRERFIR